ncbi:cysteine-rich KTR domain-containing protein [Dielma fastidiosa]|nr:cysteine-rich KTR domain-containing protein [Dielma fastidiosa]MBS6168281.1 conjugal transfer protein [Bacillota bacterium]PWM62898.1 MAG: conjugal transfer protein [Dielma fastidiosa]
MGINTECLLCPVCGRETLDNIREDTKPKNFPLFCSKCKQKVIINVNES